MNPPDNLLSILLKNTLKKKLLKCEKGRVTWKLLHFNIHEMIGWSEMQQHARG